MGDCYITRRGTKTGGATEQLGIYPIGNDGRPMGNVIVPNSVGILSDYIFKNNKNILTVTFGTNLCKMDDYSFQNCTSLQEIKIPNEVNAIPQYCFDGCNSMSKMTLPKNLNEIYAYAFQNCSSLRTVIIPDEITSLVIHSYTFQNCPLLTNDTVSKLAQLATGTIYSYAFCDLKGITEVTTAYAYDFYFSNCTNLRKATILNPLSGGGFGANVFYKCNKLSEVILPNNATVINNSMFTELTGLTTVNFPSDLITIGSSAFSGCTSLKSINIPNKVKTIGSNAFYNCTRLVSVTVSENANYALERYAFQNTGITDSYVTDIVSHASSINSYIFSNCNSLINAEVPAFADYMFSSCANLKTAKSTGSFIFTSTGNSTFNSSNMLENVIIAEGTTTIGTCVFNGCTSLKTVYLPSSVTTATSGSLTTTSSSYYVFNGCTALEDVQLGQDWNMSLRLNISNNITVDSMVAMFNSLKDLTGTTAKTLTLGSANLAKLTDEQKAIAINKNWTLA